MRFAFSNLARSLDETEEVLASLRPAVPLAEAWPGTLLGESSGE